MNAVKIFFQEKGREVALFLIVLMISFFSFALGYLYFQEFENIPIIIEQCSE